MALLQAWRYQLETSRDCRPWLPELSGKRLRTRGESISHILLALQYLQHRMTRPMRQSKMRSTSPAKALKLQLQYQDVLDGKDMKP